MNESANLPASGIRTTVLCWCVDDSGKAAGDCPECHGEGEVMYVDDAEPDADAWERDCSQRAA